jgi:gluconate kinase
MGERAQYAPLSRQAAMTTIILVCGVQGSGKSWVCRQLGWKYRYIPHDRCWSHPFASPREGDDVEWGPPGSKSTHLETLIAAARKRGHTILTEAPFGERALRDELTKAGAVVRLVFITEDAATLEKRYRQREGKKLPPGVISRAAGLKERAVAWGCYHGTSNEVLAHLKGLRV